MIKQGNRIKSADFQLDGDFIAGEAIAAGDAVAIKPYQQDEPEENAFSASANASVIAGSNGAMIQSFTIPSNMESMVNMTVYVGSVGVQSNGGVISLRSTREGAEIVTQLHAEGNSNVKTIDLSNVTLVAGETYYVHVRAENGNIGWTSSSTTGSGAEQFIGGNWQARSNLFGLIVRYIPKPNFEAFKVYKTSAAEANERINFIGFAKTAAALDATVDIDIQLITDGHGLTLTAGSEYFLSDTLGEISTSEGTIKRLVGLAATTARLVRARGAVSDLISFATNAIAPCPLMIANTSSDTNMRIYGNLVEGGMQVRAGEVLQGANASRILDTGSPI